MRQLLKVSERRACLALGWARSSLRYVGRVTSQEQRLVARLLALSGAHPRYGYRRITALLRRAGWQVGKDRVERIWRREG